jgi:hypothetical protein
MIQQKEVKNRSGSTLENACLPASPEHQSGKYYREYPFKLGTILITDDAYMFLKQKNISLDALLDRHRNGDYGTSREADREKPIRPYISAYDIEGMRLLVITERDHIYTDVMFAHEYNGVKRGEIGLAHLTNFTRRKAHWRNRD